MKKGHFFYLILFLTLIVPSGAKALGIGKTLSVKILKKNDSGKVLLINAGSSKKVKKGDHGLFLVGSKRAARGEAVQVSPGRSIWSLYYIGKGSLLRNGKTVKLKSVGKNRSTSNKRPTKRSRPSRGENEEELASESSASFSKVSYIGEKWLEISSLVNFNTRGGSVEPDIQTQDSYSGSVSFIDFSLGVELYSSKPKSFLGAFSFNPFFRYSATSIISANGDFISTSSLYYGMNFNWFFMTPPQYANSFIPYMNLGFALGSVSDDESLELVKDQPNGNGGGNAFDGEFTGKLMEYYVGVGLRYYLKSGWGFRVGIDGGVQTNSYDPALFLNSSTDAISWEKNFMGFRTNLGLSYRF